MLFFCRVQDHQPLVQAMPVIGGGVIILKRGLSQGHRGHLVLTRLWWWPLIPPGWSVRPRKLSVVHTWPNLLLCLIVYCKDVEL